MKTLIMSLVAFGFAVAALHIMIENQAAVREVERAVIAGCDRDLAGLVDVDQGLLAAVHA